MIDPNTGEKLTPHSFICTACHIVYTFGARGNKPVSTPPCCLSCGSEQLKPTDLNANDDLSGIDVTKHF